jgi:Putative silver efflux pump
MNKIIEFSLKNRIFILILFAVFIGISIRAVIHTPIDAFPDTTPVQVQINTVASNLPFPRKLNSN